MKNFLARKNAVKGLLSLSSVTILIGNCLAQLPTPTDYLSKDFHKGRREALRALLPSNSVMAVFAFPTRNFSNDVDYKYHANPDLYYFSGYTEPNAVLLIFKEAQKDSANRSFNELFFVQKKDALREQWTGKRLGIEGVKAMGFSHVYNAEDFDRYAPNLSGFDKVIFEFPQDVSDKITQSDDVHDLINSFRKKSAMPDDFDDEVMADIMSISQYPMLLGSIPRLTQYYKDLAEDSERYKRNPFIKKVIQLKDSTEAKTWLKEMDNTKWDPALYSLYTKQLRQIKTNEELGLMRKSINISALAHNEAMKAVKPGMSELELQGVQEFIHKKLGAEYVGYPSIVGAGANGCVLHYIENNVTSVGNKMVLMDVGAEYHGYSADVTRTFPANGKFTAEQKQIYDIVYEAQEAVFKICKEGTSFQEIEKTARDVVAKGLVKLGILKDEKESRLYYPHGCSHFLGLDVHDKGIYSTLKENMIITVEPGIYIPENSNCDKKWWGIAVRIEDDVLIKKDSYENLSHLAPRKSEDVEKMSAQKSFVDDLKVELKN
ncbi:aminopeptidase P family protein [Dyadobacter diqingensis]|uniref:aminopeptidase P family protein n=1 Tax=Dyadobacter diqingensis TaxID=2938121 RepID=UPI0020C3C776|nr:aminopeptidase P family protein [Dyadobacter diqingensis]